ncbi:MAG: class II fructose-bisphosphate aldolase [Clostridia bacterium]|nr:class II fructose-bisphosphate aldolase [Clostridia bacterium]
MAYVTSEQMLREAQKGGYAIGAFNFENLEMAMAILAAAEELRAPVMLQTTPSTVKYASLDSFYGIVKALADKATVPVCLHLDHGSSYELAVDALGAGYSSVMIDGSKESLEDNIALTARVVAAAEGKIPVEAELGTVGGKEDSTVATGTAYTDPDDAVKFVKESGCTSLAVGIGTAHGIYVGTPVLDTDRLAAIRAKLIEAGCDIPLVLHGASGLSEAAVRECIEKGICKVNFATELRQAYTEGIKEYLAADPAVFDPKKYGKAAMQKVKEAVVARMKVCGCDGRV